MGIASSTIYSSSIDINPKKVYIVSGFKKEENKRRDQKKIRKQLNGLNDYRRKCSKGVGDDRMKNNNNNKKHILLGGHPVNWKKKQGVKGESYYCVYLMIAHNTFSYLIALSEFFSMTAYKSLTLLRYAQSRINIALTATAKSCLLYFPEYCHCLSRIWLQYVIYFYGSLIPLEQGDWTSRKEEWENLCGN